MKNEEKNYNEIKGIKQVPEKEPEKKEKIEKVVTGTVKKRKRGVLDRLVTNFIGPEGIPSVSSYLKDEILVPAVKEIVVSSVTSAINMIMYGTGSRNTGTGYSPNRGGIRPRTNYANSYSPQVKEPESYNYDNNPSKSKAFRSDNYILSSRDEALEVLGALNGEIESYGTASLADFFESIGVESTYVDNNFGWSDLSTATFRAVRGGFVIIMPRLESFRK